VHVCREGLRPSQDCRGIIDIVVSTPAEWPNLHDAILVNLTLEWSTKTLTLTAQSDSGSFRIVATNLKGLSCPQEQPWGHSAESFINEVRIRHLPLNTAELAIETQNGDVIVVTAGSIDFEPTYARSYRSIANRTSRRSSCVHR
jgi:hypothetical protein